MSDPRDPWNLERFLRAQEGSYEAALEELRAGRKQGHWMWFVFPQLVGLGHSWTSHRYGISGLEEAREFWRHPVLGARLRECTQAVLELRGRSLLEIFGSIDRLKFRSCMTLFERASAPADLFGAALGELCGGERDPLTLEMLRDEREPPGE